MRDDGDPFQLEALEEHELQHVRQCYMAVGLSGILYNYSTKYRLWAESQAMRKQIAYLDRHYPTREHIKELATHLSTQYFLNISVDEAIQILE